MADFVERLKQAARLGGSGDSQADIARDLEVKRQTVNRWFVYDSAGKRGEPDVDMTFHIANRYGVDPKWLKTGQGNMVPDPSQDGLASDEREVVRNYRSASRPIREVIRTMLRAARKVAVVAIASTIPPLLASFPQQVDGAVYYVKRWIRGCCAQIGRIATVAAHGRNRSLIM